MKMATSERLITNWQNAFHYSNTEDPPLEPLHPGRIAVSRRDIVRADTDRL